MRVQGALGSIYRYAHLSNVLEVWRPPRGEGTRVRVLGAGVRVVRHLRPLHIRARPDLLVQKVEVPHVRVSIRPCGHELAHVRHRPAHAAPHAAVEWPVVVGVVAQRVDAQARRDPFLYRKPFARVEPAAMDAAARRGMAGAQRGEAGRQACQSRAR